MNKSGAAKTTQMLIAVGGLSGTGKSTLARRLAAETDAVWLRSDEVRKDLWGVAHTAKLPPEAYSKEFSDKTYAEVDRRMTAALLAGRTVVVDTVFATEPGRTKVEDAARALGVPFVGLWLEAAPDTLRARVDARTGDASDADSRIVDMQLGYDLGDIKWRRIDANGTAAQTYERACPAVFGLCAGRDSRKGPGLSPRP
jgi:predicted kinase